MRVVFLAAVLAFASIGAAQIAKKGNGYLFRAKYVKGQKFAYTLNVTSPGMGTQGMKMSSPIAMTVTSVAKGVATLVVKTGPAIMNGQSQGKQETQTVQVNARNQPVSGDSQYEGFASFTFPEKPVAVGSSWTGTSKMGTQMGQVTLQAKYTFIGIKTVKGKAMAEVRTVMNGTMMGKISGQTTTFILVSDGTLYRSDGKVNLELQMDPKAQPMKIPTTMSIVRK